MDRRVHKHIVLFELALFEVIKEIQNLIIIVVVLIIIN